MNYGDQQLSELAIAIPMITEVFRKNRLDFCCGGKQTLKDACEKRQLDLATIINQIEKLQRKTENSLQEKPLSELTFFIVERYHSDLRVRLPELIALAQKVERVHHDHSDCPHGLYDLLRSLNQEMLTHMMKEENVLFPLINTGRGSLAMMPVKVMMMEHDSHGKELDRIHLLTSDFTPPEGSCTTWRALYKGLEKLEEELMEHIHLENNVLFPRALNESSI